MWSFCAWLFFFWLRWVFIAFFFNQAFLELRQGGPILRCSVRARHCSGFSCRAQAQADSMWASVAVAQRLRSCGSRAVECGLSSCGARSSLLLTVCELFLGQLNPCPLHWQADSYPLHHQGSPASFSTACFQGSSTLQHASLLHSFLRRGSRIIFHRMAMQYASAVLQVWYRTPK